ncbi:Golgi apparatus protein 1-like, partial [Tropilaelaps mercedesae]
VEATDLLDDENGNIINKNVVSHRGAGIGVKLKASGAGPATSGTDGPNVLSDSPECAEDLKRICSPGLLQNNFAVLDCVQNHKVEEDAGLSSKCHHLLWKYKREITQSDRFNHIAQSKCRSLLQRSGFDHRWLWFDYSYPECGRQSAGSKNSGANGGGGNMLLCLLEHAENATDADCHTLLYRMETVVFSDYRLIQRFAEECNDDIEKFRCGRLSSDSKVPHSQGATIECLQKQSDRLEDECQVEILRISKNQGEDFHLDRPLFFACREDRERFCSHVTSGEGRVYKCLMRHQRVRDMTPECAKKLLERERLTIQDYRVSRGLTRACRDDIRQYKCREDTSHRREFRLAQILLCLENSIHNDYPVAAECKAELLVHRRFLMESYQLTPDMAAACENDITYFCQKKLETGGKTVHCLMKHLKNTHDGIMNGLPGVSNGNRKVSDQCRRELEKLLKIADVGDDWRVDPVLQESCQPVVNVLCKDIRPGKGQVLSCIMDHLDSKNHMTEDCREALLQIQYFVARDFKLDPRLYEACHADAVKHCHAKAEWHQNPNRMDPERGPIVLPCLYRYAYHSDKNIALSKPCLFEVRRVMRQRAVSVDLQPEIEEPCLNDLANMCSANLEKGQEVGCLQTNLEKLEPDCRAAVANLTEEQAEHLELNYPLFKICRSVIKQLCTDSLINDVDQGDLLQCLIVNKNEPQVRNDPRCRVAIEHFQLISLKDYRFSAKFKEACKPDVLRNCKMVKTKSEVVTCLSSLLTTDVVEAREKPRISLLCRQQLRVELFLRDENIKLDPELDRECENDQKRLCQFIEPGEGRMLECLRSHHEKLTVSCHHVVFRREGQMQSDNSVDYKLLHTCRRAIKKFCTDADSSQALDCLAEYRREPALSDNCRSLIDARLLERNDDYRLNPKLKKHCKRDVEKFCLDIIRKQEDKETELEGQVVRCLRENYVRKRLSDECEPIVLAIMRQGSQLDPTIAKACKTALEYPCDLDDPEECLKMQFQERLIKNEGCRNAVARLIHEGKADVQSDPVLHKACSADITKYCFLTVPGHGNVLSCLMTKLEEKRLQTECHTLLSTRIRMFEFAAQVAPVENIRDVVAQMQQSPARNYFLTLFSFVFIVLFTIGLVCGRITKRVSAQVKNK